MIQIDRRGLLAGLTVAAAFPSLARALSIAPHVRKGTIEDVEHVVILMQENRSFDHYFGTMNGVRGFSDPHPAPAPTISVGRGTCCCSTTDAARGPPGWRPSR